MNKPITPPVADDAIGPLDEQGQQIWSPEEAEAIARLEQQPWFRKDVETAYADEAIGRFLTMDESDASMIEMKRKWFAERGITPPTGYFDS